jgi:hypothetical protein
MTQTQSQKSDPVLGNCFEHDGVQVKFFSELAQQLRLR